LLVKFYVPAYFSVGPHDEQVKGFTVGPRGPLRVRPINAINPTPRSPNALIEISAEFGLFAIDPLPLNSQCW
jgi:hypothetical protein